jgi:hypothetical protein
MSVERNVILGVIALIAIGLVAFGAEKLLH